MFGLLFAARLLNLRMLNGVPAIVAQLDRRRCGLDDGDGSLNGIGCALHVFGQPVPDCRLWLRILLARLLLFGLQHPLTACGQLAL
ncbi:hypothetical protein ACWGY7_23635 [Xanthomonas axonopodis pv. khayae]|uniref:hypothetical protein n=1 Tax=Xanthomonas axonopodis TaxID=53413 RepID=UPI001C4DDF3A|nr:hypothetical protein [Xanthomonas axonopodis]